MNLSIVSLGSSSLGGAFGGDINNLENTAIVKETFQAGVNYVDSAPWYGHGKAERSLGLAFKEVPRSSFYIATKVGRYEAKPTEMFDFSYDRTLRSVDESLERMGLDYLDVVQVHDPEFAPSVEIVLQETLPALQKAKDSGKLRHIGMTGYPLDVQRQIIERSPVKLSSSLVYCHYNLNDTTLLDQGFLDFLDNEDIGCVNASPVAMGLLTPEGGPSWHPANHIPDIISKVQQARDFCAARGIDIAKLAIHFTLRQSRLTTTLISTPDRRRMLENISIISEQLNQAEEGALQHILDEFFSYRGEALCGWEGIEPDLYWIRLGQELECARRYPGHAVSAASSHKQGC